MALQTNDELLRVADEWFRNFCPSNLVTHGLSGTRNAELILGRCLQKYGILTISGMTESAHELGPEGKLALIPAPKEPTKEEIAAKSEARMRRDYFDSLKPQRITEVHKLNAQKAEIAKKEAFAKELTSINSQIKDEIGNFSVGHASGRQDYSRTDSGKETLRSVRDQYDRRTIEGARRALSAVRAAKFKL